MRGGHSADTRPKVSGIFPQVVENTTADTFWDAVRTLFKWSVRGLREKVRNLLTFHLAGRTLCPL
jgi:hypothetical protein